MPEPTTKWQPVTDFYKEQQATQPIDPEAERQERLRAVYEEAKKSSWKEKKAPIGIRVLTWYLFGRAGFYALLLTIISAFPLSGASAFLVDNLRHQLPGASEREMEAKQREEIRKEFEDRGYQVPDYFMNEGKTPEQLAEEQRNFVRIYLLLVTGLTAFVGFLWWNHSWKIRWGAMLYSFAFIAKAVVVLFAGWASGVGHLLSPVQMSSLVLAIGVNGFIFCYLAFWHGVAEWFEDKW